jgi:hypothetical protein
MVSKYSFNLGLRVHASTTIDKDIALLEDSLPDDLAERFREERRRVAATAESNSLTANATHSIAPSSLFHLGEAAGPSS